MGQADPRPRVLLVDDEALVLSSYARTLRLLEVDVVTAPGATGGLAALEREPFDVVIADYRMPGMNGDEFLERVRERWPTTIRLLNTAYADVDVVEEVVRRGRIFRFLTKPCDVEKLRSAVRDAVAEHRRLQESAERSQRLGLDLQSFRQIFHSALDPMMVSDLEGHLVEVNDAFLRAHGGGDRAEAFRARPTILGAWEAGTSWPQAKAALESTGEWSGEVQDRASGRHALLSIARVNDAEGRPFALVALEKDVTARRRLEQEARNAQYEVILSLAKLAEYRDPETFAHLERMRRYSRILAQTMGQSDKYRSTIDEAYVEAIFASSPLHDVGKVGIPDSVLLKPGKFTPDEWKVMQLHTRIGGKILAGAGRRLSEQGWLSMARVIALQHHEKVDGSGYPCGRKGEEIDLSARIVALADAYDAMTSRRVYKDAFAHEEARKRVLAARGTHFDSDVVEAYLTSEAEFTEVRIRYQEPIAATASPDQGETDQTAAEFARIERLLATGDPTESNS